MPSQQYLVFMPLRKIEGILLTCRAKGGAMTPLRMCSLSTEVVFSVPVWPWSASSQVQILGPVQTLASLQVCGRWCWVMSCIKRVETCLYLWKVMVTWSYTISQCIEQKSRRNGSDRYIFHHPDHCWPSLTLTPIPTISHVALLPLQVDDFQDFDSLSQHFSQINTDETAEHSDNQQPYKYILQLTDEERKQRIEMQKRENKWHRFVEDHLILKMGLIDKRKVSFELSCLGINPQSR